MSSRVLALPLLVLLAGALIVIPARAGPRQATTTITDNHDCSFRVTYDWSDFPGNGFVAQVALGYREVGGLNVVFASSEVQDQPGAGGSFSATFTLTGTAASEHQYFGRGLLFAAAKKNTPWTQSSVRDSVTYSALTELRACGSSVTSSNP
jgi:hypothetical protein